MAVTRPRRRSLLAVASLSAAAAVVSAAEVGISTTQQLGFGAFTAGTGSLTVSPGGARTTTGAVIALASEPGQAAQFTVSGDADMTYAITLPADGTVTLSNGAASMPVNSFTSDPSASGVLSGTGTGTLNVGATLDVSDGQPAGAYSGSFSVVVNYN